MFWTIYLYVAGCITALSLIGMLTVWACSFKSVRDNIPSAWLVYKTWPDIIGKLLAYIILGWIPVVNFIVAIWIIKAAVK